jgi:uncharacterized FlaG/YvyC family protein
MNGTPTISPVSLAYSNNNATTPNPDKQALVSAVSAINQSGLWPGRMLKIHTDTSTHDVTVQIVNSETNEVIEQIPSEVALRLAADLVSTKGTSANSNSADTVIINQDA